MISNLTTIYTRLQIGHAQMPYYPRQRMNSKKRKGFRQTCQDHLYISLKNNHIYRIFLFEQF